MSRRPVQWCLGLQRQVNCLNKMPIYYIQYPQCKPPCSVYICSCRQVHGLCRPRPARATRRGQTRDPDAFVRHSSVKKPPTFKPPSRPSSSNKPGHAQLNSHHGPEACTIRGHCSPELGRALRDRPCRRPPPQLRCMAPQSHHHDSLSGPPRDGSTTAFLSASRLRPRPGPSRTARLRFGLHPRRHCRPRRRLDRPHRGLLPRQEAPADGQHHPLRGERPAGRMGPQRPSPRRRWRQKGNCSVRARLAVDDVAPWQHMAVR